MPRIQRTAPPGAASGGAVESVNGKTGKVTLVAADVEAISTAAESVTEAELKALAVTEGKLGAEAVSEGKLKNLAVATGKLAAEAVTAGKIGSEAVEESKIKAGAVTAGKLAANAVETAKVKNEAVTKEKLSAGVQEELEPKVTEHSFAVGGKVENKTYPGFFIKLGAHETKNLIGVEYELLAGTSVELELQKANSGKSEAAAGIASYKATELKAEKAVKRVSSSKALADQDRITLKCTSITGTPEDLICTLFLEAVK